MKLKLPKYSTKKWAMLGGVVAAAGGLWWLKKRAAQQAAVALESAKPTGPTCTDIATQINKARAMRTGAMSQAEATACKNANGTVSWYGAGTQMKQVCMCK